MSYGVDLGTSAVKVVSLRRSFNGYKLTGAARRRIPRPARPEDLKPAIAKVLADTLGGRASGRPGVVGLSGRDINLQVVLQPRMKAVQYRTMMKYELDQRKGESSDLYLDYCTLREPDSYFPQYLAMVGIGKSAYVNDRIEILQRSNISVRDAVPNPFALYTAYKNSYGIEGGTVALLDVGAENMDLALVRGGKLIYARNITSGARVFDSSIAGMAGCGTEEGEWLKVKHGSLTPTEDDPKEMEIRPAMRTGAGQLSGFFQSSLTHAKMQLQDKELAVDKIYLSGGGARIKGFPEYLQSATKIPVELLDPFRQIDTSVVESQGADDVRRLPTDLAGAIGLAQLSLATTSGSSLSILPDEIRKRRNFFRSTFFLGVGGALLAAVLLVLTLFAYLRKNSQASALAAYREKTKENTARINQLEALELSQRDLAAKVSLLNEHTVTGAGALDVVMKLKRWRKDRVGEGVNFKEVKIVEATARERDATQRINCVFHYLDKGFVSGEIEKETDAAITLRGDKDDYSKAGIAGLQKWPSNVRAILVTGEVDEGIKGGAPSALEEIKRALSNEARGVSAKTVRQQSSEKAGWRVFEILVRFD